jgi:hypothetical protein
MVTIIESLGRPEVMIVPNGHHRADAAVYKQRYPNLSVVCPKGSQTAVAEKVQVKLHSFCLVYPNMYLGRLLGYRSQPVQRTSFRRQSMALLHTLLVCSYCSCDITTNRLTSVV